MIGTTRPKPAPTRGACGHLACARESACIYWPGTLTPRSTVRVDFCSDGCWHCAEQAT